MTFLIQTLSRLVWYIEWNRLRNVKVRLRILVFIPSSHSSTQDLVYALLASLPRSSLLNIQNRIVPLLQLDVVGVCLPRLIQLLFPFSRYLSYSPLRWHYTYFPISRQRHSYIAAWLADVGAYSQTTTPSGNDSVRLKDGIGRTPPRDRV
jgi:hypothetical protein